MSLQGYARRSQNLSNLYHYPNRKVIAMIASYAAPIEDARARVNRMRDYL